jgi:hypothetical protein
MFLLRLIINIVLKESACGLTLVSADKLLAIWFEAVPIVQHAQSVRKRSDFVVQQGTRPAAADVEQLPATNG